MTNPLLTQLSQLFELILIVLKPALVLYIGLFCLLLAPAEKQTSPVLCRSAGYSVLQLVAIALLSFGAIPPVIATVSAQSLHPVWYITCMFTFASGGLLFLWVDNLVRELPLSASRLVIEFMRGAVRVTGTIAIAFALVGVALALYNDQTTQPGWWAVPTVILGYGFLLNWLVSTKSAKKVAAPTKIRVSRPTTKKKVVKKTTRSSIKTRKKK